ncbi:MAG: zinc metalloprotease, partial [Flavobacterium sp.]|uniref:zinc metalloprotease n=1 Tax=Flavobacterium sp. TaxID=239 RepID=UPI00262C6B21
MKTITSISTKIILTAFCLFILGNTYSQANKTTSKTLFGKAVKVKNANPNNGIIRCATVEYEQYLQEKNPSRMTNAQFEAWLAPLVKKQIALRASSKTAVSTIITIPVVVHVIHNGQAIGTAPNITDNQVQSQITVLNQDYRRMLGTPGGTSTNLVAADVQIEFVLAKQDPDGNPTNGIDRVNMCQSSWSETDINETVKPSTIWDPTQYMNMWTLKFTRNDLLGYAQFPNSSGLQGLNAFGGDANTDGVVSRYDVFGSSDFGSTFLLAAPYDKGRTMTHEVGHYLGLRHTWGDGNGHPAIPADPTTTPPTPASPASPDCTATDYCADTPQEGYEHYDCITTYDTCPTDIGNDMVENYMDYTDDACMNIFTQNQKERIMVVMANSDRRKTLALSTKGTAIILYANDAEIKTVTNYCSSNITDCASLPTPTNKNVVLTNRGTSALTSASLKYSIAGGANQTQTWTGSLAQNESIIVTL